MTQSKIRMLWFMDVTVSMVLNQENREVERGAKDDPDKLGLVTKELNTTQTN